MKTILAATDGSRSAERAVRMAAQLAKLADARLAVLNVCHDGAVSDDLRNMAFELDELPPTAPVPSDLAGIYAVAGWREALAQFDAQTAQLRQALSSMVLQHAENVAAQEGVDAPETHTRYGDPAREVVAMARAVGADLIVMGRRGLGQFAELVQGSVSQKVVHQSHVSVLLVV